MRHCLGIVLALSLGGCTLWGKEPVERTGPARVSLPDEPAIASATFCEVTEAHGGAIMWRKDNSEAQRGRIAKHNAAWKLCPGYKPPAPRVVPAPLPPLP